MKKLFIAISSLFFAAQMVACGPNADTLKAQGEADSLGLVVAQKDSILNEAFTDIELIASTLNEIATKQNIVVQSSASGEITKTKKAQIMDNINSINELLDKNKKALSNLNATAKKLKEANVKIASLESLIESLQAQVESKDAQIADLLKQIEKLNIAVADLQRRTNELQGDKAELESTITSQEDELNTVYYVIGKEKELVEKGLIDKKGFITIKRTLKNTDDLTQFTKGDRRSLERIAIGGKGVKVITSHPDGSYTLVEGAKRVIDEIVISDHKAFWRNGNFLVISYR